MKNYSILISSIKEKSINDKEVSYSKKKKGFLNKNTLKVLVLSLLAVGVINVASTKVNATTNDFAIDTEISEVTNEEDTSIYATIGISLMGLNLAILLKHFLFNKKDRHESNLDFYSLAKEILSLNSELDINIVLYTIFVNLDNLPIASPINKDLKNQYEYSVETMDALFMEMQKLIKGHESEYGEEILKTCNFKTFNEYILHKGYIYVDDYKKSLEESNESLNKSEDEVKRTLHM